MTALEESLKTNFNFKNEIIIPTKNPELPAKFVGNKSKRICSHNVAYTVGQKYGT